MGLYDSFKEALLSKFGNFQLTGEFLANLLIAIILLIIGVFIGKLVKFLLRKGIEQTKINKLANEGLIDLFLTVIKWSIYIFFLDIALIQINIPIFMSWLTVILGAIPALTGSLIIITIGFFIASFLRRVIQEMKIKESILLGGIFFYFTNYIFLIFAFKTALISLQDSLIVNVLLITFTILGGLALLLSYFKFKK